MKRGRYMKNILIVEDDIELRNELKILLENNNYQVTTITTFNDVVNRINQINPDLILLDLNIPNLNGQLVLKELRKDSNVPVIIVTSKNTEVDEVVSMSYGADDYITKPYNPTILLLHIEAIFKRIDGESNIITYHNIKLNLSNGTIKNGEYELTLTKNEQKILYYLIKNKGHIVTRDDIINYLWDTEDFIDDNTLTVNINRLRKKLATIKLDNIIETRRGEGYIIL